MNKGKTVAIIGAGVGGIATAVFLAKNGYDVSVYEKNASPGGRCGQIVRDGHRFDLGATIFLMPNIYRDIFDSMGLRLEEAFKTEPLDPIYTVYFGDGTRLAFTNDFNRMQTQLEAIEPGSFDKFLYYIAGGYKKYHLAFKNFIGRNFYSLFEFVNLKNAFLLLKLKAYTRHIKYVRKFFKNKYLRKAFTFQNIYVGQNPLKAPALFTMIPAAELIEGTLFTMGGMFSIIEKLCSVATESGVKFHYNSQVEKIEIIRNRAGGIRLKEGNVFNADIVVANADLPYVYRELLPDRSLSLRMNNLKYTCSAIVFHWGLDKVYPSLGHHSVFLSDRYEDNLRLVFSENSLSDEPSFYVHAPVRTDPDAAPAGQDTLTVIVPAGHLDEKHDQDWVRLKNAAKKGIMKRLAKEGLDDIEEHIKFEISFLPGTWQNMFNLTRGATFGSVNHNILQMGYFRPGNQHRRYKNLYFVGGSTHPGNGVPLVLLSAQLTSERIMRMNKS